MCMWILIFILSLTFPHILVYAFKRVFHTFERDSHNFHCVCFGFGGLLTSHNTQNISYTPDVHTHIISSHKTHFFGFQEITQRSSNSRVREKYKFRCRFYDKDLMWNVRVLVYVCVCVSDVTFSFRATEIRVEEITIIPPA